MQQKNLVEYQKSLLAVSNTNLSSHNISQNYLKLKFAQDDNFAFLIPVLSVLKVSSIGHYYKYDVFGNHFLGFVHNNNVISYIIDFYYMLTETNGLKTVDKNKVGISLKLTTNQDFFYKNLIVACRLVEYLNELPKTFVPTKKYNSKIKNTYLISDVMVDKKTKEEVYFVNVGEVFKDFNKNSLMLS